MFDSEYAPGSVPHGSLAAGYLPSDAAGNVWTQSQFQNLSNQGIETVGIFFMPYDCPIAAYTPVNYGQAVTVLDIEGGTFPHAQEFVDVNGGFTCYMDEYFANNVKPQHLGQHLWLAHPCDQATASALLGQVFNGWTITAVQYAFDTEQNGVNSDISVVSDQFITGEGFIMDHATAFGIAHGWYGIMGRAGAGVSAPEVENWAQAILTQGLDVAFQSFISLPEPLTAQNLLNPLVHTDEITPLKAEAQKLEALIVTVGNLITELHQVGETQQAIKAALVTLSHAQEQDITPLKIIQAIAGVV